MLEAKFIMKFQILEGLVESVLFFCCFFLGSMIVMKTVLRKHRELQFQA